MENELQSTLRGVMKKRNISLYQLAAKSDVPIDTIKNIYYGRISDPKASTLVKLSKALDLSMNYLYGDHLYKDDEREMLHHYRNASPRGKAVIRLFARAESTMADYERASNKYIIPCLIPIGIVYDGIKYHSCDSIKIETTDPRAYIAIEITTNYFAPAYCEGDRILLENRFPKDTEYAVFVIDECAYLRQYLKNGTSYVLHCLNGRGEDILCSRMDEVDCIGTLIGVVRT